MCGAEGASTAMMAADAEPDELVAAAAGIICSMRGADLAGWTPPWRNPEPEPSPEPPSREGELIWPAVARGKRSSRRRSSPSAGSSGGKGTRRRRRWGRASPPSPLDYSGSGSGSAASTSGGEDGGGGGGGGFCSLAHRPVPATKVGAIDRPQLTFPTPIPLPSGQRPRKKLRLPEIQQLVRSLSAENESLREEMRDLQRACKALSKENDKLETRLGQSNSQNEITSKEQKGKELLDQQLVMQSTRDCFVLPDLNLPPQDSADVSTVH